MRAKTAVWRTNEHKRASQPASQPASKPASQADGRTDRARLLARSLARLHSAPSSFALVLHYPLEPRGADRARRPSVGFGRKSNGRRSPAENRRALASCVRAAWIWALMIHAAALWRRRRPVHERARPTINDRGAALGAGRPSVRPSGWLAGWMVERRRDAA